METLLKIDNLEAGYGKKQILFGVSLKVHQAEIAAMIGPNGAGKSTLQKAVCGLLPITRGEIVFNGKSINGSTPADNVASGITFAPQGSRVFDELTVKENLEIGGYQLQKSELKERIDDALQFFPALRDRLRDSARNLSGGEQQMVAIARSLIPRPKLLMLDEPSLGLSPRLVNEVFVKIVEIKEKFGVTILVAEQKIRKVLQICDHVFSLRLGKISFEGPPSVLMEDKAKLKELFL